VEHAGPLGDRRRLLVGHVRHAEPATERQLRQVEGDDEVGHRLDGEGEAREGEHVAADVGVHADEVDARRRLGPCHRSRGGTRRQREAELRVVLAGLHVHVGVRLDAGRDPQQHGGAPVPAGDERLEPVELVVAVDHDPADACVQGCGQLPRRLVVAVEDDRGGVGPCRERHVQLPAGGDVDAHALLGHERRHRPAEEGLAGVARAVAEGCDGLPAALAEVELVVDEQRCPVLGGEVEQVDATDGEAAPVVDGRGEGEEVAGQLHRGPQRPADAATHRPRTRPGRSARTSTGAITGAGYRRATRGQVPARRSSPATGRRGTVAPGGGLVVHARRLVDPTEEGAARRLEALGELHRSGLAEQLPRPGGEAVGGVLDPLPQRDPLGQDRATAGQPTSREGPPTGVEVSRRGAP
jgi:hypothetical protein